MSAASSGNPRRLLRPTVFAVPVLLVLVGLGLWQLQRLQWKEGILARIEERLHGPAQPLPAPATWPALAASDFEYTRVEARGVFDHKREMLLFRPAGGVEKQPGFHVYTPFQLDGSGRWIIVNRGFVPESLRAADTRRQGQVEGPVAVTGVLRAAESRSTFTPADDAARRLWYTRDPLAMAKAAGLAEAAPFTIDADETPNPGGWPRGGAAVVRIPNDHLSYALTWFGLAGTLVGVYLVFAWRQLRS